LACRLLEDDGEWWCTLDEVKKYQTGFILCALFVVILCDCIPSNPLTLWQEYKTYICDDLPQLLPHLGFCNASQEMLDDYGLYLIKYTLLWGSNRWMKDVGMVAPSHNWDSLLSNPLLQDHLQFNCAEEECQLLRSLPLLNEEQHIAFNCIMHSILSDEKRTFSSWVLQEQEKHFSTTLCVMLYTCTLSSCFALPIQELLLSCFWAVGLHIQCSRFLSKLWTTLYVPSRKILPLPSY
jgi:hypothetical protein